MMWIEPLLMLSCGWMGGVVSALLIRHALDGRRPLDPALLPTAIAALPALPPQGEPATRSPYAPRPKPRPLPLPTERVVRWRHDVDNSPPKPAIKAQVMALPKAPTLARATNLLPSIGWGQPYGGEERTLTQEVRASAALSEHGAQAPRRRPLP